MGVYDHKGWGSDLSFLWVYCAGIAAGVVAFGVQKAAINKYLPPDANWIILKLLMNL